MLTFHPLANIFPLMTGPAFERFKLDIRRNRQLDPILTLDGRIVDGRNRYRACVELGIVLWTEELTGAPDVLALVLSRNAHRRQLNDSQKACAALELEAIFTADAAARMKAGIPVLPGNSKGKACVAAAAVFGVSGRYVEQAKWLRRRSPELLQSVFQGLMPLSRAVASIRRAQQDTAGTRVVATDLRSGISRSITMTGITAHGVIDVLRGSHGDDAAAGERDVA